MSKSNDAFEELVGETFDGRYRLDALLGVGGMGAVFRAHHVGLRQDVAVKILRPDVGKGAMVTARFQREAQSASRLDHPNCVRVNDFGELPDGTKYLVMQLLEGCELEARLGKAWEPVEAIDTTLEILDALEHAHAHGIVHRDLKPENIFITTDYRGQEQIKLVDFGIAKIVEGEGAEDRLTQTGMVFGTPLYMSPEQAAGGQVDARTDLYAVGLILYELLSGHPPFEAEELAMLLRMHILRTPPPLPESLAPSLVAIVMQLLEKSREDRPADAAATGQALRAIRGQLMQPVPVPVPVPAPEPEASLAGASGSGRGPLARTPGPVWVGSGSSNPGTVGYGALGASGTQALAPGVELGVTGGAGDSRGGVTVPVQAVYRRPEAARRDSLLPWIVAGVALMLLALVTCGVVGSTLFETDANEGTNPSDSQAPAAPAGLIEGSGQDSETGDESSTGGSEDSAGSEAAQPSAGPSRKPSRKKEPASKPETESLPWDEAAWKDQMRDKKKKEKKPKKPKNDKKNDKKGDKKNDKKGG